MGRHGETGRAGERVNLTGELTEREAEVLEARGRGEPLKQISAELGISISSADSYRRRAVEKLRASSTIDAVRKWERQQRRQKLAGKIRQ